MVLTRSRFRKANSYDFFGFSQGAGREKEKIMSTSELCSRGVLRHVGAFLFLGTGLIALAGCVTPPEFRLQAIKDYRYFAEYGGYFPVYVNPNVALSAGRSAPTETVMARWVVPVRGADGKPEYTPPATRDEAERRVQATAKRERVLAEPVAVPLQPVGLGAAAATMIVSAPVSLAHRHEMEREVSIKVVAKVTDPNGTPLPGAGLLEVPSVWAFPCYADGAGQRSFVPPRFQAYEVGSNCVVLMAEHLPLHLRRATFPDWFFKPRTYSRIEPRFRMEIGPGSPFDWLDLESIFTSRADARGTICYRTSAAGRLLRSGIGKAQRTWITPPSPLNLYFIVWAPGFKPAVHAVSAAKPKDEIHLVIALEPLPDQARVANAVSQFERLPQVVAHAIRPSPWSPSKLNVNDAVLQPVLHDLASWALDDSLPTYLRWNAYDYLRTIANSLPGDKKDLKTEAEAGLTRVESAGTALSPYLSQAAPNPWRTLRTVQELLGRAGEKVLDDSATAQAKAVLAEGEAALPGLPLWDSLKSIVALAASDRDRAVGLAWGLDHRQFFRLFYGLDVEVPLTAGGLGE